MRSCNQLIIVMFANNTSKPMGIDLLLEQPPLLCFRLSRFQILNSGICSHSATRTLMRCCEAKPGSQSTFQFTPKVLDGVEVKAPCRTHQSGKTISLWTWLCVWRPCHIETLNSQTQTLTTKLEAHYCLKYMYYCMQQH